MLIRLRDIPQLSPNKFAAHNSCFWAQIPAPCHFDLASGRLLVEKDWQVVGWCDNPPDELMGGRRGQIVLAFFHPEYGEIWQHYPLFTKDDRDAAILDCTKPPVARVEGRG